MRCVPLVLLSIVLTSSPAGAGEPKQAPEPDLWESRWDRRWDVGWSAPPPSVSLDLRGGHRRLNDRMDTYALAVLRMPLDALLNRPPRIPRGKDEPDHQPDQPDSSPAAPADTGSQEQPASQARDGKRRPAAPSAASPEDRPPEAEDQENDSIPLRLVRDTIDRSLSASGAPAARSRLSRLAHRARMSGLTPELRVRGVQGFDTTLSQETAGIYPGEVSTRDRSDALIEVRLTFRLDRLLFNSAEPGLERARARLNDDQLDVAEEATELLLAWFQNQRSARRPDLLPEEKSEARARSEAALVQLHVLTGGWFRGLETYRMYRPKAEAPTDDQSDAVPVGARKREDPEDHPEEEVLSGRAEPKRQGAPLRPSTESLACAHGDSHGDVQIRARGGCRGGATTPSVDERKDPGDHLD